MEDVDLPGGLPEQDAVPPVHPPWVPGPPGDPETGRGLRQTPRDQANLSIVPITSVNHGAKYLYVKFVTAVHNFQRSSLFYGNMFNTFSKILVVLDKGQKMKIVRFF